MGQRKKNQKLGVCFGALNQEFAKGEELEPHVKNFYKYIKIGRCGEQISATQTYHRRSLGGGARSRRRLWGSGGKTPSRWAIFCNSWKK